MEDKQKWLASQLTEDQVKNYWTTILIGDVTDLFKRMLKSGYYTITTADEVRAFLDQWVTPLDKPLVFEDLSLMTPTVQTYLLKFIEDPPMPLIIMASKDNVSPIILSRCKRIIKLPSTIESKPIPLPAFIDEKMELLEQLKFDKSQGVQNNSQLDDLELDSLKRCPMYFYMKTKVELNKDNIRNINSYLKLL